MKFAGAVAGFFLCLIVCINPIFANAGEGEGKKADTSLVQLDPFILNVSDTSGPRFAKLGICLDLLAPAMSERVKAKNGPIRDAVIMLVTAKTAQEIMSVEGRMQIKDELLERINSVCGDKLVKGIYFTEVVVQ